MSGNLTQAPQTSGVWKRPPEDLCRRLLLVRAPPATRLWRRLVAVPCLPTGPSPSRLVRHLWSRAAESQRALMPACMQTGTSASFPTPAHWSVPSPDLDQPVPTLYVCAVTRCITYAVFYAAFRRTDRPGCANNPEFDTPLGGTSAALCCLTRLVIIDNFRQSRYCRIMQIV